MYDESAANFMPGGSSRLGTRDRAPDMASTTTLLGNPTPGYYQPGIRLNLELSLQNDLNRGTSLDTESVKTRRSWVIFRGATRLQPTGIFALRVPKSLPG